MKKSEILNFIKQYEDACNSYIFSNVSELINENAVFFFSDKNLYGKKEIQKAFESTWEKLGDDIYSINNINIIHMDNMSASLTYDFYWEGINHNGENITGNGRGTSILAKTNGKIQKVHEHLSKID